MSKPDYRRRADRESEILAQIAIDGALSVEWLQANRQRQPALDRLLATGKLRRLPCKHPSVMRFEDAVPAREGLWARIARRFTGGPAW